MAIRMPKKPKRPQPAKPSPLEWRPYAGSTIRVVIEAGAPVPAFLQCLIVKQKGAS